MNRTQESGARSQKSGVRISKSSSLIPDLCNLTPTSGLAQMMTRYLENYFADHEQGSLPPPGLYDRVLREIEKPLLQVVLQAVGGNQKKAAAVLGINRNTLRKKLNEYEID